MADNFISETDQFLAELDRQFPEKSESQQVVIKKYDRIIKLRDKDTLDKPDDKVTKFLSEIKDGR